MPPTVLGWTCFSRWGCRQSSDDGVLVPVAVSAWRRLLAHAIHFRRPALFRALVRCHPGPAASWVGLYRVAADNGEIFYLLYACDGFLLPSDELTFSWFLSQDNMDANYKDYILQGERYFTVQDYTDQVMPVSLLLNDQPVGQVQGTHYPLRLCKEAQRLFFLSIHMLNNLVRLRQIPKKIGKENIVLSLPYYMPKLKDVEFNSNPNDEQIDSSVNQLSYVFENLIRHKDPNVKIPAEVHNLLSFMRSPRVRRNFPLIRVHSCLIPMENRGHLAVLLYQYTVDVLRIFEPSSYRFVMKEMVYDKYWEVLAEQNVYLERLFDRGHYDPVAARVPTSQAEHFKYNRHAPCHALQDAGDPNSPHGLRYTHTSINHALYTISEMLLASVQRSLHLMGHLEALQTVFLFPWGPI